MRKGFMARNLEDPVKEERFLQRIKEEFPDITWKTYRYITQGWDHVVLILDETIVFRAPKDMLYRNEFKNEIRLLQYLKKKVNLGIPDYIYVSRDGSFAGYNLVKGQELTTSQFQNLTASEKETAANQLAEFITTLHATPQSVLKRCQVRTENLEEMYEELVRDTRALLYPRLPEKYIQSIEQYFDELETALGGNHPKALVHNDLGWEHILWDSQKKQINIIDFSDRSLGDPAIDFTGLQEYGMAFTTQVFELYRGKKDEDMLYRSELYFKRVPLYFMKDALQGYPCTFEEGYEALKNQFKA
ncbi:MAG: aminoglycoside phosphotransferase family protein [Theionarchaea archaeon]|nr:aminoglycoside phosphotransferase family protein [Theionarchaea archaeon]MBU7000337.1 aminoglycoside phosphotransferase family protein [Theionarchaea archaeon]MBU7020620.1 aminoglycoside phosphotransferase family protein [Theionarchaea archaeon]MBU7035189.1 aminoglycoside phosphotransferase family protein [Theionarchaea archaeon]MBU7040441.1 aminoglycoside phosphotransferase family protein [Theionarchaea archaeon]